MSLIVKIAAILMILASCQDKEEAQEDPARWSSGGGELLTDTVNPWFLDLGQTISYCITMDANNFGTSLESARAKIQAALQHWRSEFEGVELKTIGSQPVKVATNTFVETTCEQPVDLRFQLGILNDVQANKLGDPGTIVAQALRTEYDPKTMQGKGVIYVSPERGPYALSKTGIFGDIHDKRWSIHNGKILEIVLIHELGHTFGMQHEAGGIMGSVAPAMAVSEIFEQAEYSQYAVLRFQSLMDATAEQHFTSGKFEESATSLRRQYFGIPTGATELNLSVDLTGKITLAAKAGESFTDIGTFNDLFGKAIDSCFVMPFYLPPEQIVFKTGGTNREYGDLLTSTCGEVLNATFMGKDGLKKNVLMKNVKGTITIEVADATGKIDQEALTFNQK